MKALIILKGSGDTGKSQTLIRLTELLCAEGNLISKQYHYNKVDFSAVIEHHGIKIGIITIGDPGAEEFVLSQIDNLLKEGCDIIVAASRTRSAYNGIYETLWRIGKENGGVVMETSTYRTYEGYEGHLSHEQINDMCSNALLVAIKFFLK